MDMNTALTKQILDRIKGKQGEFDEYLKSYGSQVMIMQIKLTLDKLDLINGLTLSGTVTIRVEILEV